ncbi:MAG: PEP-CTERM sorting domain-containing protein [Verrucomicrobiota bacterium]
MQSICRAMVALISLYLSVSCPAGPYAPAANQSGSTALNLGSGCFVGWATGWTNYIVGTDCDFFWQTPPLALGQPLGDSFDIVCLGDGGEITMTFDIPIADGPGFDFAVFENSINDTFLELAYVEVSSDGANFFRFPNDSLTPNPVPSFGGLDPTDVTGLASKYQQGYGTPFDLNQLAGVSPLLDLQNIRWVRMVDIVGDGTYTDTSGDVIYDPHPTLGSAGFDLEAVGVINYPRHVRVDPPVNEQTTVSLWTLTNHLYRVQMTSDLILGPWANISFDISGNNDWQSFVVTNFPVDRAYFRSMDVTP